MPKPTFQWHTERLDARRIAEGPAVDGEDAAWAGDARAEAFELFDAAGTRVGRVVLGLALQRVDAAVLDSAGLEDLSFAVRAWLIARGQRTVNLRGPDGASLLAGPLDVADLDGRARGPSLITLCPSNAEMVDALGCFERVVACESSSDHPPAVESLERLGPDLAPDLDRVAALAPGLVVASLSVPGMERIVTGLRRRGVPQVVLAPRSVSDVRDEIVRLGVALDAPAGAVEALRRFDAELAELAQAVETDSERVRVYLEWWPRPMFTPGADCYSNELIALAGGVNVFAEREGSSLEVEAHEVVAAAPQVCFVSWCGAPFAKLDPRNLIERPGLEGLSAARHGAVYPLDERFSGRPGPRMLEAARVMRAAIHSATRS